MRILPCAVVVSLMAAGFPAFATKAEYEKAMLELATSKGCMACHTILPATKRADGLPPIAPAWRDVALKYRDDPRAPDRLTRTILAGSNAKTRHWAGKVSDVTMPPNETVISETDARMLVNWILILAP